MKRLLIAANFLSGSAMAVTMEVITLIHRSPPDYALCQQNAEIPGQFNTYAALAHYRQCPSPVNTDEDALQSSLAATARHGLMSANPRQA